MRSSTSRSKYLIISVVVIIKRTSIVPLLALLVATGADLRAQQQKIAYVASEAILEKLPDAQAARSKLTELQMSWMRDIQRQEQEIAKLSTEIQTNRLLWSAQEKRDAEAKMSDLQARLATYRSVKFGPNQEFDRQQSDLMGPVFDKVWKAIDDEARAQKYDFVFDKSSRGIGMVYSNPVHDLTWAVLKRLGVEVEPPADATTSTSGTTDANREQDARRNRGRRDQPVQKPTDGSFDPNEALNKNDGTIPPAGGGSSSENPR